MARSAAETGTPSNVSAPAVGVAASSSGPQLAYSPPPFPYGSPYTRAFPYTTLAFYQGFSVSVTPSNVGPAITGCTISPALPAGLSLSASDCSITGTPTATSPATVYTITAASSIGSTRTFVAASVSAATSKVVNIPEATYLSIRGTAITPIHPQLIGGSVGSDCVGQQLPVGITKQPDCSITGTPTSNAYTAVLWNGAAGSVSLAGNVVPPAGAQGTQLGFNVQFPWQVVSASSPVITYGGKVFGQAMLTVGTSIYPIVPSNAGAAITSCTIAPALPAGLSLSQSDCSISGTPTATSVPTTYVITAKAGASTSNQLPLNLIVQPARITALKCQTGTLCVHPLMPLFDQGDSQLVSYVNAHGYSVASDPGWCTGGSGAMMLKTYFEELARYTSFESASLPAPFSANDSTYAFVFNTMTVQPTDIQNGGGSVPGTGMQAFLARHGTSADIFYPGLLLQTLSEFNNPANYGHGMPLGQIGFANPHGGPGHAVALNGVEGSYYKIFDPWGAVYNTTIAGPGDGTATMNFVSGNSHGCLSSFGGSAPMDSVHWVKDYVFVEGAPAPTAR